MKIGKVIDIIENEPEDIIRELPVRKKEKQKVEKRILKPSLQPA